MKKFVGTLNKNNSKFRQFSTLLKTRIIYFRRCFASGFDNNKKILRLTFYLGFHSFRSEKFTSQELYIFFLFPKPIKASIKKSNAAAFGHLTLTVKVVTCVMLVATKAAIEMEVSFK